MKFDKRFEIIKLILLIKLLLQLQGNSQIENLIHNDFAKPKNFQQFNAMKGNNTGKTVGFQVFIHL